MRVDFVVRSDAPIKQGGDSLQVAEYRRGLEALGVDVREVPFGLRMALRPEAIVHVVNIDRPFDFLEAVRQARGHPLVVSPIHHELRMVRRMRRAEPGRSVRALSGKALPPTLWELAAFVWRCLRQGSRRDAFAAAVRSCARSAGVWRRVGLALDGAAAVQLLAVGEGQHIRHDTGWRGDNAVVVPNGLPSSAGGGGLPWDSRRTGVVVVGRVEPRKRQVAVVQAAVARGIEVTFAGAVSSSATGYGATFTELVTAAPGMRWLGALSHDETLDLMRGSRVLLNASWVEVQSLVDIEAAACGCYVVCMAAGSTKEWLGGAAIEMGDSVEAALEQAARLATLERGPDSLTYDHTWDASAQALWTVYAEIDRTGEAPESV